MWRQRFPVTDRCSNRLTAKDTTTVTGTSREFASPPLAAGKYSYDIQASWSEAGKVVTQTRHVEVAPGARLAVNFPEQPPAVSH